MSLKDFFYSKSAIPQISCFFKKNLKPFTTSNKKNLCSNIIHQQVVGIVDVTTLTSRQYCVVLNPVDPVTGKNKLGAKKLIKGEISFFLKPGETLAAGIQVNYFFILTFKFWIWKNHLHSKCIVNAKCAKQFFLHLI